MARKAKMGEMMVVKNLDRHPNANDEYVALWVENESGADDTEQCLLFKKATVEKFTEVRFGGGVCSGMKPGRLHSMRIGEREYYLCLVKYPDGTERTIRLTDKMISAAETLAGRNPEDIPDRGFLNDLLD